MKLYNIDITNKCNLNCIYCYPEIRKNKSVQENQSIEYYKKKILKAKKDKYNIVHFSGAESTLSPYLLELIEFSRSQKLIPSIITNGVLLSDYSFLEKLIKSGLKKIEFTFNCSNPKINEQITKVKNITQKQLKALKNINQFKKIDLKIFTIVNSLNYTYLPEHANYLTNNFKFNQFILLYVIGKKNWMNFVPKHSQTEEYIIESLNILKKSGAKLFIGNIPYCFLKERKFYKKTLEYKGEQPCPDPHIKTIKHNNCQNCKLNSKCRGLNMPYYKKYGNNELINRYF